MSSQKDSSRFSHCIVQKLNTFIFVVNSRLKSLFVIKTIKVILKIYDTVFWRFNTNLSFAVVPLSRSSFFCWGEGGGIFTKVMIKRGFYFHKLCLFPISSKYSMKSTCYSHLKPYSIRTRTVFKVLYFFLKRVRSQLNQ